MSGFLSDTLFRIVTSVAERGGLPKEYALQQNYPNPFNPRTTIRHALPHRSHVTLTVFNTLDQQIAQLVNSDIDAGYHETQFNATNLASGVYFYRIQAGSFVETKRLMLLRFWQAGRFPSPMLVQVGHLFLLNLRIMHLPNSAFDKHIALRYIPYITLSMASAIIRAALDPDPVAPL